MEVVELYNFSAFSSNVSNKSTPLSRLFVSPNEAPSPCSGEKLAFPPWIAPLGRNVLLCSSLCRDWHELGRPEWGEEEPRLAAVSNNRGHHHAVKAHRPLAVP